MIKLLYQNHGLVVEKSSLLQMEQEILSALEFSMHFISPLPFLERFQMILGFEEEDADLEQIVELSR